MSEEEPGVHVDWHMTPAEWGELCAVLTGKLAWDNSPYIRRLIAEGKIT